MPLDEEDDIRKAIELSIQTATRETNKRQRAVTHVVKQPTKDRDDDDFDAGLGFEQFAKGIDSGRKSDRVRDDIANFDFPAIGKKEEGKEDAEFNFNFDNNEAKAQQSVPQGGGGDLLDMLSQPS